MNQSTFTYKLNHPENISEIDAHSLSMIIEQFPYFQSARALYLKSLHAQRSYLYNNELKKTAAYTTDRDVLFDLIISDDFITYKPINLEEVDVFDETFIEIKKPEPTLEENIEKSILSTIAYIEDTEKEDVIITQIETKIGAKTENFNSENHSKKEINQIIEEKLEIGKPLPFQENEKHSFSEWLKLTKAQPIEREIEVTENKNLNESVDESKLKKLELIDRFIETNPKITPSKTASQTIINIEKSEEDASLLMTETLAKIYLEQKKYQKAIQAYQILILKYPEKSVLFAQRIEDIKALQQYNN
ncbi:tetratricopeptide repeat protein [Flavobacterium sp. I3-2]|uniref:tetratricopeptide repeat protein n=1 Tax=Flavobacterium sp. I3-2 TaxID=2748319 RepID=UPI0015B0FE7D|nr:tetratricopeptide repeat protein [Flavobacterium sp. I3-2]